MLMRLMSKGEYLIVPKGTKFTGSGKLGLNLFIYLFIFCLSDLWILTLNYILTFWTLTSKNIFLFEQKLHFYFCIEYLYSIIILNYHIIKVMRVLEILCLQGWVQSADMETRSQNSYTPLGNGIVNHRAPIGGIWVLPTTHVETNANKMRPLSSHAVLRPK